ncbi:peroxiredoxin [Spiroplasma alleghenense]|uniref:Bacterioferritin comigratory protein n=1 Tax=Spiroplasma alleghenense TaxID=216931 RepID=A0A345Z318_9MOLU|nr:peroxiredoxin [Spiroplasma alleghenense]AXK50997.1 ahpC/TSA family protein [Spiroplasma alleghenense]
MDWKTIVYKLNNDSEVMLKDLTKENGLILFFYPHANSTICALEAKEFQKNLKVFEGKGYGIVGASRDQIMDQKEFSSNCNLDFPLICDTDEILHKGLMILDNKDGDNAIRSSFILDKDLNIIKEMRNVEAVSHIKDLIAAL